MRADLRTIVDLGPVHMNGRIYDPLLGRFLSADILVQNPASLQDFNRYSYVRNNPLSLTDPSGWACCAPPMFVQTMQAAFVMGHGKEYMDAQAKSANAGAEAVGLAGIGVIPVVGDVVGLKMDIDDLTSPTTALWEKGLAVLDIGLTLSTASVAPNIGPERRAVGVIVDEVKSLEKGTNAAAKAASDVTTTAAKKVDTTPTPDVQTAAPTTPAPTETGNLNSASPATLDASKPDVMSQSGAKLDPADKSGSLTMAGRALDKHGSTQGKRAESNAFPSASGNAAAKNEQGQSPLDDILTDPKQQSYPNGKGGVDIHAEDGRGARFDSEDQFKGFLEPRRK